MMNKKGALAFEFIYGLIFLFAMGVLFIVFNQVLMNHGVPASENLVPVTFAGKSDIVIQDNDYLSFWNIVPYLALILVLLYWIIKSATNKNPIY